MEQIATEVTTPAADGSEPFLDSRQAARLFGKHHKTLERHARLGTVPGYKKFGQWYFLKSELDAWLRSQVKSGSQSVRVN